MSFDVCFLRRPADGDWHAALDLLEEQALNGDLTFSPDDVATWERVAGRVRERHPDCEVLDGGDRIRELVLPELAVQLSCFPGEWALAVPYWYEDARADEAIAAMSEIATIVERETGLVAFDLQADAPFLECADAEATARLREGSGRLHDIVATLPASPEPEPEPVQAAGRRRWWQRRR